MLFFRIKNFISGAAVCLMCCVGDCGRTTKGEFTTEPFMAFPDLGHTESDRKSSMVPFVASRPHDKEENNVGCTTHIASDCIMLPIDMSDIKQHAEHRSTILKRAVKSSNSCNHLRVRRPRACFDATLNTRKSAEIVTGIFK